MFLFGPLAFLFRSLMFLFGSLTFFLSLFGAPEQQISIFIPPAQPIDRSSEPFPWSHGSEPMLPGKM